MSCPYLTEVTMSFCRAYPVKKLVPTDSVVTQSSCDGECFGDCPVFREASARLAGDGSSAEKASPGAAVSKGERS